MYGHLAAALPDAYLPDLANACNTVAEPLLAAGRNDEAIPIARRSIAIYLVLLRDRPSALVSDVSLALETYVKLYLVLAHALAIKYRRHAVAERLAAMIADTAPATVEEARRRVAEDLQNWASSGFPQYLGDMPI